MAEPNVVGVTSIYGKTDVLAVTTSAVAITTCASNKLCKINSLVISNIDGTNAADITVDIYRSSTAYHLAKTITVPPDTSLVVISKATGVYLQESDTLRLTASANGDLEGVCSYEVIDDA